MRTDQIDLDLRRRDGLRLPVRLLHRVAYGHDGAPGASRTLALNRAPGGEPAEEARAAEVRFARFFNSTPMAIATVDRDGVILRSNAAFARLLPGALIDAEGGSRLIVNGVAGAASPRPAGGHRRRRLAAARRTTRSTRAAEASDRAARLFVTPTRRPTSAAR